MGICQLALADNEIAVPDRGSGDVSQRVNARCAMRLVKIQICISSGVKVSPAFSTRSKPLPDH